MTFQAFQESLHQTAPPEGLSPLLTALWWDAKGEWDRAHKLAQTAGGEDGAWVHAYLHRKEGDLGNASYWYHRANRPMSSEPLESEWAQLVKALGAEAG